MAPYLDRLVAHLEWANQLTLSSLRATAAPDPKLLELFAHILAAEHVWHARLSGSAPSQPVWPALSLDECARLSNDNVARLRELVHGLAPDDVARSVTYRNSAGREFTSSVEDIVLHVALHGAYHRGQIAAGLRRAGAEPEPTDFIAFTRGAAAATRGGAGPVRPEFRAAP
jgi:uncharacterized damage-inducible protein DinB